jgi:PAS domain S-box-containing protein
MMEESSKTERALIEELASLRQRILELEKSQTAKKIAELHKEAALNELPVSENKYRKIVENAYDQIMYMDLDGIIQYANRAACDLAGPLNLIGLPMRTVIAPHQLERHEDLLQRRREGDLKEYSFEWELFPPGSDRGVIMDVRSSALIENGKPSGVLLIARDMTDRKLREEEMRVIKEKYQMLVEGIRDIIFEVDHKGIILYCSPSMRKIWGHDAEDMIGKHYVEFVHPDDQALLRKRFSESIILEENSPAFRVKTKTDETRWARARMKPQIENDKFVKATGILIDITDQIMAEKALTNSELLFRNIFSMSPAMMGIHRISDGTFLEINEVLIHVTGYQKEEIIGHTIVELGLVDATTMRRLTNIFSKLNKINNEEIQYKTKTGELRYGLYSAILVGDIEEKKLLGLLFDITERKHAEESLKLREEESKALAKERDEINIALRVLLKKGDKDREKLEESLQSNVNQLVKPFLSKLRTSQSNPERLTYLNILETNLSNIVSPFINQLSSVYKNLTPKETQIAELIRQGKRSKEIAEVMNISVRTVDVLRYSVRKKLGLNKKKANLQSLLSTL